MAIEVMMDMCIGVVATVILWAIQGHFIDAEGKFLTEIM